MYTHVGDKARTQRTKKNSASKVIIERKISFFSLSLLPSGAHISLSLPRIEYNQLERPVEHIGVDICRHLPIEMPREQIKWSMKQSVHDAHRLRAQQSCTYSSIVNVDRTTHPYIKSFEREQTWTLTQSMSKQNKRYQSSIENIHLTIPSMSNSLASRRSLHGNQDQYDYKKMKLDRSISLLPPLPPTKNFVPSRFPLEPNLEMYNKTWKNTPIKSMASASTNPMRIIYLNGEFVVRI